MRFVLQEDARAGDVLEVDPATGLLRRLNSSLLTREAAEEYAWDMHDEVEAAAKLAGYSQQFVANEFIRISDIIDNFKREQRGK